MENKVDPQLLMNDQMKAVLQKSAELAGDAFVTDVGFAEMRENYVRERRFWNEGGPVMTKSRRAHVRRSHGRIHGSLLLPRRS